MTETDDAGDHTITSMRLFGADTGRLESFSDGVFAIAITLLVLGLDIPPNLAPDEILGSLGALGGQFYAAALSFMVIARFWIGHHSTFRVVQHLSGPFTVMNMMQLATVVFLPFPTLVLADYADTLVGVTLYAVAISSCGITAALLLVIARVNGLLKADVTDGQVVRRLCGLLAIPVIFLLSIPIAVFSPLAAMIFWLTAAVADRPMWAIARRYLPESAY